MRSLHKRITILLMSIILLMGCFVSAQAQYSRSRRVRVYHPGRYNKTRVVMNRRALRRKIIRQRVRARARHIRH